MIRVILGRGFAVHLVEKRKCKRREMKGLGRVVLDLETVQVDPCNLPLASYCNFRLDLYT